MSESLGNHSEIAQSIRGFTLVAFGIQLTLIGLFDGSSLSVVVIGAIFGIVGTIPSLKNLQ